MIEFHKPPRVLATPEDRRSNNAEQDAYTKPARLDLHHDGEKHDGNEQDLQNAVVHNQIHRTLLLTRKNLHASCVEVPMLKMVGTTRFELTTSSTPINPKD